MSFYRKKPVVIEARPFDGSVIEQAYAMRDAIGRTALEQWCGGTLRDQFCRDPCGPGFHVVIPTLEGEMAACPGDWIIKGIKGEFYPCKPDIFAATYEPVAEGAPKEGGVRG